MGKVSSFRGTSSWWTEFHRIANLSLNCINAVVFPILIISTYGIFSEIEFRYMEVKSKSN